MNVTVYTTPTCGYCRQVKEFLSRRGLKFTEYDVSRDRAAADEMIRKSGQMGVPVIIVDDQKQGLHDKIASTYVVKAP